MKNSNIDLHPLILAGGLGTRLKSVSENTPKCLVPIANRPFVYYLLDQLQNQGLKRATLCSGIHTDSFIRVFKSIPYPHFDISFADETSPLGTGGAIKNACKLIPENLILVMNGDTYLHFDLPALIKFHLEKRACASMIVAMTSTTESGEVTINHQGEVLSFRRVDSLTTGHVNCGVYLINKDFFIKKTESLSAFSLERDFLEHLDKGELFAFTNPTIFYDIGTPERLERFRKALPDIIEE